MDTASPYAAASRELKFSQITAARSEVYGLLAAAFNALPSAGNLRRLAGSSLLDAAVADDVAGVQALAALRTALGEVDESSSIVTTIAVERTRLLRGIRPGQGLPPACECTYLAFNQASGSAADEASAAVVETYDAAGFAFVADIPPDYVGSELAFLEFVAAQEAQAWRQNERRAALALAEAQLAFIEGHIGRWIGPLQERVGGEPSSGFWPALLALTETHLGQEKDYLQQLLERDPADGLDCAGPQR